MGRRRPLQHLEIGIEWFSRTLDEVLQSRSVPLAKRFFQGVLVVGARLLESSGHKLVYTIDFSSTERVTKSAGSRQHPQSQQVEVGAAVHLSLDALQPVHLSLSLSVTPRQRKCSLYGR